MPIEVELPDGRVVEFPDGTDNATMERALSQFAAQQPARADFSGVTGGVGSTASTIPEPSAPQSTLFGMGSDFRERSGAGVGNMLSAAARDMFGSREAAAKYLAEQVGGRVGQADDGQPTVILPDGTQYRTNEPGADMSDVANVAGNVGAFLTPAGWASRIGQARNLGLGARAGLQAVAAGGTDVALQAGFSDGIDPTRTASAAAGGAGGEAIGTGVGYGVNRLASLGRSASGQNTRQAQNMLTGAGVSSPQPAAINRLAAGVEEINAGADPGAILGRELYGFQYTQGQRAADPVRRFDLLSREELLRQSPGAGGVFSQAADANRAQLAGAVEDIGQRMGGQAGATPAELAQTAAGRLQAQADDLGARVSEAYARAGEGGRTAVSSDSVRGLPGRMQAAVADFAPNPTLTPATSRTLQQISEAANLPDNVSGVTLKAIETQRRIINNNISAAANPSDRAAMTAIKREFDGWLDEAVEGALISGDEAALQALKDARQLRFEYGRRFEGRGDSDRFITGLLDGSRTPEELVNIALGAGQVSKAGGARFIDRLRLAADNDPQVIGALRAAHFQRMTTGANGEPLAMGQIVRNIKSTEYNNASVLKALYSPEEWAEVRRLAAALDPLIAKGDFARTSGTAERMGRMMFNRIGGGLPIIGEMVRGIGDARATVNAARAISQPLRLPTQAPAGSAAAGAAGLEEYTR